uniref:Uncharacterized protein n=1 Tax=Anguilla anguilla TaxID=7936 RepID=A0A0E9UY88_ANGAN
MAVSCQQSPVNQIFSHIPRNSLFACNTPAKKSLVISNR